jgi:hypothetical protein
MSLGAQIAARRNTQRRIIDVPEWGEDDVPLRLYCGPITAGDIDRLQRKHKNFLNDMTIAGMVDLIIHKAEMEDGAKAFTLEDKPHLMRETVAVISEVAGQMFGETVDVEQAEKN